MANNYENIGGAGQDPYNGSEWSMPGMESALEAIKNAEQLNDEQAQQIGEKVIEAAEAVEDAPAEVVVEETAVEETPAEEATEEPEQQESREWTATTEINNDDDYRKASLDIKARENAIRYSQEQLMPRFEAMLQEATEPEEKAEIEQKISQQKASEQKYAQQIDQIKQAMQEYEDAQQGLVQEQVELAQPEEVAIAEAVAETGNDEQELDAENMQVPGEVNNTAETSAEIDTLTPEESREVSLIYNAGEIADLLDRPSLVEEVRKALEERRATADTNEFASAVNGEMPSTEEFISEEATSEAEQGENERASKVAEILGKLKERVDSSPVARRVKRMAAGALLVIMSFGSVLSSGATAAVKQSKDATRATTATAVESTAKAGAAVNFEEYDAADDEQEQTEAEAGAGREIEAMNAIEPTIELHKAKNGTRYNYAENFDRTDKTGRNAFGGSVAEYHGDVPGMKKAIVNECLQSPEVLAAYVASMPEAFGLKPGITAESIDDKLSNGENGGELQTKYMKRLADLLADEDTETKFIRSHDVQRSYIIVKNNPDKKSTPKNLEVQAYDKEMKRHGDKQVIFSIPLRDENGNITGKIKLQVNESCVQPVETLEKSPKDREDPPIVVETPVTPDTPDQPEKPETPVQPEDPEEPEDPGTPESPTPTPVVSESPTPTPVVSESPTPTPVVSESPTPTPVVSESPTPTPVVSESPTPTPVVSESPTPTPVVSESPTPTPVVSESPTPTPVVSESPTPTPSNTPKPKDPENLYQNTAGEGLAGDLEKNEDITKDEENKETEEAIRNEATDGGDGSEKTEETQVGGLNQSQAEQEQARQDQEEANKNEDTSTKTNDEILDYLDQFYNRIYDQQRGDDDETEN